MSVDLPPAARERFLDPQHVGSGGFGRVYQVWDRELQKLVALKVLHEQDAAALFELKREFRILRRIPHPNVVRFHELFTSDQASFYTMDLVVGCSIDAWFDAHRSAAELERLARSLLHGVAAIHDGGAVHRDLKPANVLVDEDGALVVVDFGFATLNSPGRRRDGSEISGTFAYMAPEALHGSATSASDWYSIGVILYELAVRDLPSRLATSDEVRAAVERTLRRDHLDLPWLPDLVRDLLVADPAGRAAAAFAFVRSGTASRPPLIPAGKDESLVGREREIAALRTAFDSSRSKAIAFELRGTSGVGKSEILKSFLSSVASTGAIVLEGHCHTTERVPYNALDGVIDDLAQVLKSELSPRDQEVIAPPDARHAATRLFPVLRMLSGFDTGPAVFSARETRELAIAALRACLGRLATVAPLVIAIEDVHWGDGESAALLADILSAPTFPVLLSMTDHWPDSSGEAFLNRLAASGIERRCVTIEPFDDSAAERLLRARKPDLPENVLRELIGHAEGLPYLLLEVLRANEEATEVVPSDFADLLARRIGGLADDERAFLEAAMLAGLPTDCDTLASAAKITVGGKLSAEYLAAQNFLKIRTISRGLLAGPYHEQIRRALLSRIPMARQRDLHLRLAHSLEARVSHDGDVEPVFVHYLAAGDRERAGHYAELAGSRASATLAFDRAARLFREAADLSAGDTDRSRRSESLAAALAADGRSEEAARCFLRAARLTTGGHGEERLRSTRSLLEAARHFARSGHREEARGLLREILGDAGVALDGRPASPGGSRSWWPWMRSKDAVPKSRLPESPENLLWELVTMLALDDPIAVRAAIELSGQRVGREPMRLASALEMASAAPSGDRSLSESARLFSSARWTDVVESAARGRLRAVREGRELCAEVTIALLLEAQALVRSGHYGDLVPRLAREIARAEAAGDLNAACLLRTGETTMAWLLTGDALTAAQELEVARATAAGGSSPLLLARIATTEVLLRLHEGRFADARQRLLASWETLTACSACEPAGEPDFRHWLRARTALAATALLPGSGPETRADLTDDAIRCARVLLDLREPCARGFAAHIEAGIEGLRGGKAAAAARARAISAFQACDMPVFAAACELGSEDAEARSRARVDLERAGASDRDGIERLLGC